MSTPAPNFVNRQEYRESNRRMAEGILAIEPAPYTDGGYVRRVVEVRGRRSGEVHLLPIAVISLNGRKYLVSPDPKRNWVLNLLSDPRCTVRSRDIREPARATRIDDPALVAEVVSTYLALMNAPWAISQFPFPPDANRDQIRAVAEGVAVFELVPICDGSKA